MFYVWTLVPYEFLYNSFDCSETARKDPFKSVGPKPVEFEELRFHRNPPPRKCSIMRNTFIN